MNPRDTQCDHGRDYTVPTRTWPDTTTPAYLRLISRDLDAQAPWLTDGQPVPTSHILTAAARTGSTPTDVAQRLVQLGYQLPEWLKLV